MGGQGRGDPCDRQGVIAETVHRQGRHQGAVHATGVGHHHPAEGVELGTHEAQGSLQGGRQGLQQGEGSVGGQGRVAP
jgi:hypothetical protein